ncbi:bifunctional (p)ppGpp synthase/hydrolase RelA [Anaerotignum neopropionicum]|uniref:Bifunctional (P)ppGpp synthase/hydrolase RelA n=1 Tax=Anaerotignum neopropionicum TaxID=36847 RepID=A0A136WBY4_9FIRM|nr:GTP pyrophosphokinase [Anaerotignum neopropionicum]KXL52033.1 bifunctional (p)ppGpp synthase/hydrolase RelA [Anaerotignum neopropionicum]
MLEKAIILAANAHMGQLDKGGNPYILHPVRVMLGCKTMDEKIVAILHDTLENSDLTADDLLKEGFSKAIVDAVVCLTRKKGEDYMDYIQEVAKNPLAKAVKLSDLADNMDLKRLPGLTPKDFQRLERYLRAQLILEKELKN